MTTLVVLRHAKSAWPEGVDDRDRPLAGRGRREAPLAGQWLREHVNVDLVVCSPAKRTRQTWQLVAAELGGAPEFRVDDDVYTASVRDLLGLVRKLPPSADVVLLIGHNPGLSELVGVLGGTEHELKTSSIAVLRGDAGWADVTPGSMRLVEFTTPRPSGE
jgi:phosphohistidine phosphatase